MITYGTLRKRIVSTPIVGKTCHRQSILTTSKFHITKSKIVCGQCPPYISTLAECLVFPIKRGLTDLEQAFEEIINSDRVEFIATDRDIAKLTAIIRAKYNFQLPDSIQIATAISSGCDAFLTNDVALKKVTEIRSIVVNKLEV